jgi:hypothetical protein
MGLDAFVFCDCFERGKLREPPPRPELVFVTENGSLDCKSDDPKVLEEFDLWIQDRACEHEEGILTGYYIGSAGLVSQLWDELAYEPSKFPILLTKVLYSGTHCGDSLEKADIIRLKAELKRLSKFRCADSEIQEYMPTFQNQMSSLVKSALSLDKPIAF